MTDSSRFPHHRLDAYRLALELAVLARQLTDRLPRVLSDNYFSPLTTIRNPHRAV